MGRLLAPVLRRCGFAVELCASALDQCHQSGTGGESDPSGHEQSRSWRSAAHRMPNAAESAPHRIVASLRDVFEYFTGFSLIEIPRDVGLGHDSAQTAVTIDNRDAPNLLTTHCFHRGVDILIDVGGDGIPRHDVGDGRRLRRSTFRDETND
jgi:hypothetical protein